MRNKRGCSFNSQKLVLKLPPMLEAVVFKNKILRQKIKSMWHSMLCIFILNEDMFWGHQGKSASNIKTSCSYLKLFWILHAQSRGRKGEGHL